MTKMLEYIYFWRIVCKLGIQKMIDVNSNNDIVRLLLVLLALILDNLVEVVCELEP